MIITKLLVAKEKEPLLSNESSNYPYPADRAPDNQGLPSARDLRAATRICPRSKLLGGPALKPHVR